VNDTVFTDLWSLCPCTPIAYMLHIFTEDAYGESFGYIAGTVLTGQTRENLGAAPSHRPIRSNLSVWRTCQAAL
jgi:hypothetical protein